MKKKEMKTKTKKRAAQGRDLNREEVMAGAEGDLYK
jgi:hypothetical protein